VAAYALDWDGLGRTQRFDVLDASTGAVLAFANDLEPFERTVSGWTITGHVLSACDEHRTSQRWSSVEFSLTRSPPAAHESMWRWRRMAQR